MEKQKTIFVIGGTGNQGGAVVKNLLKQGAWKVKVLSRNATSDASKALTKEGVEVIQGDLDDPSSFGEHLDAVHGIFSVQNFENGIEKEVKHGKAVADLAKEKGVQHLIYSSVSGADLASNVPHFNSKYEIEEHIKSIGLAFTILRPTSFYENLMNPEVKKRVLKGKLVMPLGKDVVQEFISVQDIGKITAQVFGNPSQYIGKTVTIASDKMTMSAVSEILSKTMNRKIKYEKLPLLIARLVMGKNLTKMFRWINNTQPEFVVDMEALRKEFPGMTNLETWIKKEFG